MDNETLQTIAALGLVVVSLAWLVWRAWTQRKKPPSCRCDAGCGCAPGDTPKKTGRKN